VTDVWKALSENFIVSGPEFPFIESFTPLNDTVSGETRADFEIGDVSDLLGRNE